MEKKKPLIITITGDKFRIELKDLLDPEDIGCVVFNEANETDTIRKLRSAIVINQFTVDDDKPELIINAKEQFIIGYNSRILLMLCLLQGCFKNELTFYNEEDFKFTIEVERMG